MTADRFVHNPFSQGEQQLARMYKTGDEACWRDDGVLVFLGRVQKDAQASLAILQLLCVGCTAVITGSCAYTSTVRCCQLKCACCDHRQLCNNQHSTLFANSIALL